MEAPSKAFLLFFLLPDWLKLNHLKSRMECGFSDIFSRHFCSTLEETIGLTNYAASFGAKNVQKTTFEAAEMILGRWNQQEWKSFEKIARRGEIKVQIKVEWFSQQSLEMTHYFILFVVFTESMKLLWYPI